MIPMVQCRSSDPTGNDHVEVGVMSRWASEWWAVEDSNL
jgi:hypothetical protein